MRILVIGAGAVGSAIARDLAANETVSSVRVCDTSARALGALAAGVPDRKLKSYQVSARDHDAMRPILAKSDCVVGALGHDRLPDLARLAVSVGCHYCDLGASDSDAEELWLLDEEAKAAGRWIVTGCGLAPGLVNLLCLHAIEQFDRAKSAHIRVGAIPQDPKPPFQFSFSWSAEKVLDDYTGPVRMIEDGAIVACDPLTRMEQISFEGPFDGLEAFCTSGGLGTLPDRLLGRVEALDLKTIRWPGHADRMRFLIGLGFAEAKSIDVRTHLTYRDLLIRRMRQRLGGLRDDVVLVRIQVEGEAGGRLRTLRYELVHRADAALGISAMKQCTAIPASIVASQLGSGALEGGGVSPPEGLISGQIVLEAVRARGLDIREIWTDGSVAIEAS